MRTCKAGSSPAALLSAAAAGTTSAGGSADAPQYARLEERRKLKTGEPNYFDHPLFGVILEVSPAGAEGP